MKKFAVMLSGCGHQDGAEITESVSALIALAQCGGTYQVFAPDEDFPTVNHLSGEVDGRRNALVEACRIARGNAKPLSELKASDYEGLVIPGGYGVAKNLCDWAAKGSLCQVHSEVKRSIEEFYKAGKPILAICIAPALVARVLGPHSPTVTVGAEGEAAQEIRKTGATHVECEVDDFVTDRENKIITTPAYMCPAQPHEVFSGISKAAREFVEMA